VDDEGCMWRTAKETREHAKPEAVEAELRAQVEAALAAGIKPTHLDCHMATAMAPEFIDIYLRFGEELQLPVLYTRFWNGHAALAANVREEELLERSVRRLEARGNPVFQEGLETPWGPHEGHGEVYERLIDSIKAGLTFLSFHPNRPGDIEVIDPPRCHCRTDEWRLFQDESFIRRVRERGIHLMGFRAIASAMAGGGHQAVH
jgi:chitin disaccharide deacetylase